MKSLMNIMRSYAVPVAAVLLTAFTFSSCLKNASDYAQSNQPAAGLMAFNLAADKPAIGFTLSNNQLGGNAAINYTGYTGVYLPIYIGNREVRSFDYFTGSTLATVSASFADSMYYSAFLMGANGNYRNVVIKDELAPLTAASGKVWVRYVNAVPDSSGTITITQGETSSAAPYATVSSFAQVNAGTVHFAISNGGSVSASRDITLAENNIYTVLFSGIPGETDPDKKVQVRFIQNGTVTP